jgi:hypothetical protein
MGTGEGHLAIIFFPLLLLLHCSFPSFGSFLLSVVARSTTVGGRTRAGLKPQKMVPFRLATALGTKSTVVATRYSCGIVLSVHGLRDL